MTTICTEENKGDPHRIAFGCVRTIGCVVEGGVAQLHDRIGGSVTEIHGTGRDWRRRSGKQCCERAAAIAEMHGCSAKTWLWIVHAEWHERWTRSSKSATVGWEADDQRILELKQMIEMVESRAQVGSGWVRWLRRTKWRADEVWVHHVASGVLSAGPSAHIAGWEVSTENDAGALDGALAAAAERRQILGLPISMCSGISSPTSYVQSLIVKVDWDNYQHRCFIFCCFMRMCGPHGNPGGPGTVVRIWHGYGLTDSSKCWCGRTAAARVRVRKCTKSVSRLSVCLTSWHDKERCHSSRLRIPSVEMFWRCHPDQTLWHRGRACIVMGICRVVRTAKFSLFFFCRH